MRRWVIIRYRFDENIRGWVYDSTMVFRGDRALLEYLRAQAPRARDYRYEITLVKEEEPQ